MVKKLCLCEWLVANTAAGSAIMNHEIHATSPFAEPIAGPLCALVKLVSLTICVEKQLKLDYVTYAIEWIYTNNRQYIQLPSHRWHDFLHSRAVYSGLMWQ